MSKASKNFHANINNGHRALNGNTLEELFNERVMGQKHLWIALASYEVSTETLREAVTGGTGPNLDSENLVSINLGCFICEVPFAPGLLDTVCIPVRGR